MYLVRLWRLTGNYFNRVFTNNFVLRLLPLHIIIIIVSWSLNKMKWKNKSSKHAKSKSGKAKYLWKKYDVGCWWSSRSPPRILCISFHRRGLLFPFHCQQYYRREAFAVLEKFNLRIGINISTFLYAVVIIIIIKIIITRTCTTAII